MRKIRSYRLVKHVVRIVTRRFVAGLLGAQSVTVVSWRYGSGHATPPQAAQVPVGLQFSVPLTLFYFNSGEHMRMAHAHSVFKYSARRLD
jgi:hypothetical protein